MTILSIRMLTRDDNCFASDWLFSANTCTPCCLLFFCLQHLTPWLTWLQNIKPGDSQSFLPIISLFALSSWVVLLLNVSVLRSPLVLVARTLPCNALVRRLLLRMLSQLMALLVLVVRGPRVNARVVTTTNRVLLGKEKQTLLEVCNSKKHRV